MIRLAIYGDHWFCQENNIVFRGHNKAKAFKPDEKGNFKIRFKGKEKIITRLEIEKAEEKRGKDLIFTMAFTDNNVSQEKLDNVLDGMNKKLSINVIGKKNGMSRASVYRAIYNLRKNGLLN